MTPQRLQVMSLRLCDVALSDSRPVQADVVRQLVSSMKVNGLISPITVKATKRYVGGIYVDGYCVIAGNHRLSAARALAWSHIEAFVVSGEAIALELVQIDENLCRAELSAAERSEALARRKQIWQSLGHESIGTICPETDRVSKRGRVGEGRPVDFATATADATGQTKRDINRHLARADAIGDDLTRLVGTSLDSGVELDALAAMPAKERGALIDRAAAGEAVSARAATTRALTTIRPAHARFAKALDAITGKHAESSIDLLRAGGDIGPKDRKAWRKHLQEALQALDALEQAGYGEKAA